MLNQRPRPSIRRLTDRFGRKLCAWADLPRDPDWDQVRMDRSSANARHLELVLTENDKLYGWARAFRRSDGTILWLERPTGPPWARDLLHSAVDQWQDDWE